MIHVKRYIGRLTDEQIGYLKENYDIKNMSKQDYYNLMADVTQMNVLSAEDIARQQVQEPVQPA